MIDFISIVNSIGIPAAFGYLFYNLYKTGIYDLKKQMNEEHKHFIEELICMREKINIINIKKGGYSE